MANETVMSRRPTTPEARPIHPGIAKIIMRYFKYQGLWVDELMAIDNKLFCVLVNGWFAVGVVTLDHQLQFVFKTKMS